MAFQIPQNRTALMASAALHLPETPDTLLTRDRAAQALTSAGYPIAPKTLATKATRGGGPPYSLFSGRALYRWGDALDWAKTMTSAPRCSTSEGDARRGIHDAAAVAA